MIQDDQPRELSPLTDEPRASFVVLWLLILFFAATFFVNQVDWETSTYDNYTVTPDEVEDQISIGKSSRKVAFVAIGLVGALMIVLPGRQRVSYGNLPFALLGMYVVVCMASFIWTDTAWLTTKRLGIGVFGLLAIVGAIKHLSTRDVIDATLGIGTILLVVSIYAELRLGTFTPLASEYRFAGIVHPNTQGSACGLMVIAAFFGMQSSSRGKLIYVSFFVLAGCFLALTKSRTSVAACFLGVSAAWYLVASRRKQTLVGLALPTAACAGLIALLLLGVELSSSATTAAQLGRDSDEELASFNGRLPLWSSVIEHIAQRPLLGYGYHGFWTPDRVYEMSLEQEWTVPNAHSAFLDVVLNTGLVGGAVIGLCLLVTFRRIVKRCLETTEPTDCFAFALFVYALIQATFESSFSQPNGFEVFVTGVALLRVVSARRQAEPALPHFELEARQLEVLSPTTILQTN